MTDCVKCPRLVEYRTSIKPKFPLLDAYHNAPVLPFGDPKGSLCILGLAPGREGANRTGFPFVGDRAGVILYGALYQVGYSNTPDSTDGRKIILTDVIITNSVWCVPPENKPTRQEFDNCRPRAAEVLASPYLTDVLCIGRDAYEQLCRVLDWPGPRFEHGLSVSTDWFRIHCSYHTSGYNQSTGRINQQDVYEILLSIKTTKKVLEFNNAAR